MIPFNFVWPILLGATIVVITGLLDDIFELSPMQKLIGLTFAALEIYFVAGIKISTVTIPYFGFY